MKIKCPFEPFENAPDYTEDELSWHLQEDHEVRGVISDYICRLLFKIHEKIEKLEKEPYHPVDITQVEGKHFLKAEDMPEICFICVGHQQSIIELKSLLENK